MSTLQLQLPVPLNVREQLEGNLAAQSDRIVENLIKKAKPRDGIEGLNYDSPQSFVSYVFWVSSPIEDGTTVYTSIGVFGHNNLDAVLDNFCNSEELRPAIKRGESFSLVPAGDVGLIQTTLMGTKENNSELTKRVMEGFVLISREVIPNPLDGAEFS